MKDPRDIILAPVVSEKSYGLIETGVYTFKVDPRASKPEIHDAIESIFGLRQGELDLSFTPCLPSHWPRAELTLRRDGRTMRFILIRATPQAALAATAQWGGQLLAPGQPLAWTALAQDACFAIPLAVA